ncbi:MAG: hypothetical protein AAF579_12535 [Cyanobacteria bacterium P01_C01_bin.118]
MVNRWLSGVIVVLLGGSLAGQSMAQSYPDCPPPGVDEYLLFVRGEDESTRDRTVSVLPMDIPTLVCNYLGDTVVRAGGFNSLEVANSWALYLNDIEQLNTVVVEPTADAAAPLPETVAVVEPAIEAQPQPLEPAPTAEVPPPTEVEQTPAPEAQVTPSEATPPKYEPVLLGNGVAVLVDYQQNPDIGRELAQQGPVGLAVYLQQPYLLVLHTTDSSSAAAKLQQLVDSGLTSFLVDGEKVIRLTESIR